MRVFCPECHKETYRLEESGGNIRVIQNGKTLVTTDHSSNITMSISCPDGHPVKLQVKGSRHEEDS